jgi:hypothetical protein
MVKKVWVLIALVAGLVLGFFLTTFGAYVLGISTAEPVAATARVVVTERMAAAAAETHGAPKVASPANATPLPVPVPVNAPAPAPIDAPGPGAVPTATSVAFLEGDYVNAPPGKQLEFKDPLHEEFLREERDDSWAYLREAELENSMVMELSQGHFRKDRIECRASFCEVNLSATGDQVARLSEWMEEKNKQRSFSLEEPLMMRGSSFSGDGNNAQARILYMKPELAMQPPRKR